MNTKIADSKPIKLLEPIKWYNLPSWLKRTAIADLRTYQRKNRPMSIKRLMRMLIPNLQRPLFIVGSGRSGTTFLGSCVATLPEFSYHFEPILIKAAARCVYEGSWETAQAKHFYRRIYAWLMRLHFDADLRFSEKTPTNSLIFPFFSRAFPDAQFIHIVRDGRDTALSLVKKSWFRADGTDLQKRGPSGYLFGHYARFWVEPERVQEFEMTSDIHRCIWVWRRYVESILEVAPKLPESQYHEVKYEDLVFNTAYETDRLLDFLEISDKRNRSLFQKATAKIKPESVGRWKSELSDDQLQQIYTEAGHLLSKLGYIEQN